MKKFIYLNIFIVLSLLLVGCGNKSYLEEISYSKYKKMIDNKETFVIEVVQDGCSNCATFTPKFKEVLEENKFKAYSVNLTQLSQDDNKSFGKDTGVEGTPTVIFYKDGKETSTMDRLVGANISKSTIKSKLVKLGYIK